MAAVSDDREEPDELSLLLKAGSDSEWAVQLDMQEISVKFKVDSGADVNVLTHNEYRRLSRPPTLDPANRKLVSVGSVLQVLGQFKMDASATRGKG